MSQQVVTELVIDSDTSGADQFSQSMDKADASAKQATSSAANMTLAIAGVGIAVIGAIGGLRAFIDYVGTTNKQLVDIADNANNAGMSTKGFQETLFAARAAGLTEKDFVSGLDKIGADLTAASRGVTDFGKLFEANGVSIKDTKGQLITTKAALSQIADLMNNATPQVQAGIAHIVGLSKDWIPFLRDGSDAIEDQKQKAAALGVIIDDGVIQKARDFDREWRTAVATWDLQFKASLGEILPSLVKLANIAGSVLNTAGQIGGFFSRSLTPLDQQSSSDLQKDLADLQAYRGELASVNAEISDFQRFKLENKAGALGLDGADIASVDAMIAKVQTLIKQKQELARPTTRIFVTPDQTVLPSLGGDSTDAVDRAINTLRRHIEQQNADTQAVDLGAAAQARFRAQAAETSAVQANGGMETAAQAGAFASLREKAAAAADALARAKIASDIKFGSNTAFLSQDDVAIASQLKSIYPDVATALNSAEAAQLRFNSAARQISTSIENDLVSGLTDIATSTKSVGQGFSDLAVTVLKSIEQMIIKISIVQPLMQGLQNTVSGGIGGGGGLFGLFGLGSIFGSGASSDAAALAAGTIALHEGGIVGSEATFSRYVHPAYFDNAPRFHTGGIAGDEVPIIAKKGEGVFTPGQMAALGSGGSHTNITYAPTIDARGADAQVVARLAQALAQDRQNFERNVTAVVTKTRANNPGTR